MALKRTISIFELIQQFQSCDRSIYKRTKIY